MVESGDRADVNRVITVNALLRLEMKRERKENKMKRSRHFSLTIKQESFFPLNGISQLLNC